jgi:hypothetical protein
MSLFPSMLVLSYYYSIVVTLDSVMRVTDVMGQYYSIVEYGDLGENQTRQCIRFWYYQYKQRPKF